MAAIPYMPLYVADYLADAAHLSTIEHGAYLLLIMTYWQRGEPLPDSDKHLARIARVSDPEWEAMKPDILDFFCLTDAGWEHSRIERELEKVRIKSRAASNAGKASAERKANNRSTDVEHSFNHTDTDTDTDTDSSAYALPAPELAPDLKLIVDAWNDVAARTPLAAVVSLNDRRKKAIRIVIAENGIQLVCKAIAQIENAPFLLGQGDRGWKLDFDTLIKPKTMLKLIEGGYHGSTGKKSGWLEQA